MKPYYDHAGATLYHGDARAVLPSLGGEVDLLLTDPPYGVAFQSNMRASLFPEIVNDRPEDAGTVQHVLALAVERLRDNRHAYIFGGLQPSDVDRLHLMAPVELVWDKAMAGLGDLSLPWGPAHEKITFAVSRGRLGQRDGGGLTARLRKGSVLREQRANATAVRHPTEKPVGILRQMIESSSLIGETVLDPFAGSGSTLVAALMESRKAIGVEIEERYCEVAAKRLDDLTRQGSLFGTEAA